MSGTDDRIVRTIACGAGFAGDRTDPAVKLAESGQVDTIVLECLAERTLVPGLRARRRDPGSGADSRIERRLTPILQSPASSKCRIISNFGAANPVSGAQRIERLAKDLGRSGMRIAAAIGDDVRHLADRIAWDGSIEGDLLGAHAYLGTNGIVEAVENQADIIVTGRTADSALFAGDLLPYLDGSEDAFAGAIAVGHLLECSGQLTGGNFEAPGVPPLGSSDLANLGYPIARVFEDGTAEITVVDGSPALINRLTCTLQLLYEVHDPSAYITPDLTVDFSGVSIEEIGPSRVRVSGARAADRPARLKVSGFVDRPGAISDVEIAFAGRGALDRARRAADVLRLRLAHLPEQDLRIDLVGLNSVLGAASRAINSEPPEVRVHVSAKFDDAGDAQLAEDEVYALTLSGPAGGCGVRSEQRPRLEVVNGYIDRELVKPSVEWSNIP
ncbi:acyclic terpene utilization AtuA family protein [Tsuneonella sp. CC-YZS046]|uniref:acyclic terpene utilization AtuA family protein n=1 Tax=Tsuneonella sp. CC-YZS046 TaxID=3042152 RepID=UPI002D78863D|nr:acyclic terpene utilization AtuA family protein [Tsuneonella sp. CC-YZS046]WRO66769.1 acyclic terpene utilization AtuA family protein [Tsuneonella sp. CC-YZS046]